MLVNRAIALHCQKIAMRQSAWTNLILWPTSPGALRWAQHIKQSGRWRRKCEDNCVGLKLVKTYLCAVKHPCMYNKQSVYALCTHLFRRICGYYLYSAHNLRRTETSKDTLLALGLYAPGCKAQNIRQCNTGQTSFSPVLFWHLLSCSSMLKCVSTSFYDDKPTEFIWNVVR